MPGLNKVMIICNLGKDPEMRFTANGSSVATFPVAVSRQVPSGEGERREETEWFSVVAWNKLAELCNQYLQKGRKVYVEGRLQTRSWDAPDGTKKYRTEVIAQEVQFLDSLREGVGAAAGSSGRSNRNQDAGDFAEPDDLPFE
jgi:single-strand DNA-binding protein